MRKARAVRSSIFRALGDAIAGYARGQAGRSVEPRWLLLAAIVGYSERLECDSRRAGVESVAGRRQIARRVEGEFRRGRVREGVEGGSSPQPWFLAERPLSRWVSGVWPMANLIRSRVRGWCASYRSWGETTCNALCRAW
jgi:hypothetical protein